MMWGNQRATVYDKLPSRESEEEGEWKQTQAPPVASSRSFRKILLAHFNLGFFVVNLIFLCTNVWVTSNRTNANWLLKQVNTPSPMFDRFTFSLSTKAPNASLFNDPYSLYKADPSPEVDAAWEAINDTPVFAVSAEDIKRAGKDVDYAAAVPEEWGYGKDKYLAANDGQHLIHCLDELRKYAHWDYYYYPKYGASMNSSNVPAMHVAHRGHCIGILLHTLTCQPSLQMVSYEWMEEYEAPWPDFGVNRKCIDHSQFYDWQEKNQIPRDKIKGFKWKRPEGKPARPIEPGLKKIQVEAGGKTSDTHGGLGAHGGHGEHEGHGGHA